MAKLRRKKKDISLTSYPDRWDMGPDTPAQRYLKVIEDAKMWDAEKGKYVNPNNVKRARRGDMCSTYYKRGKITKRQHNAALKLREAYEATMLSPTAILDIQFDDSCSSPDNPTAGKIDSISRLKALIGRVPSGSKAVVNAVVLDNQSIGYLRQYRGTLWAKGLAALQDGLDAVADGL